MTLLAATVPSDKVRPGNTDESAATPSPEIGDRVLVERTQGGRSDRV